LADTYTGADADAIRHAATAMLEQTTRYGSVAAVDAAAVLAKLRIYPAGRILDQNLTDTLIADSGSPGSNLRLQMSSGDISAGVFIDLNDDKIDEFVFLTPYGGRVYENQRGKWIYVGYVVLRSTGTLDFPGAARDLIDDLTKGNVSARPAKWYDLVVGKHEYRINAAE
jgi:hypothetical protein